MSTDQPASPLEQRDDSVIRAQAVGRSIDGRYILRHVTIQIDRGQFVALLGANGAGKSTLLNILATLTPATEGQLFMFGRPVRHEPTAARRRIGLIGHASMLYRDLSALENLCFFGRLYGVRNPKERAMDLLRFVGLSSRALDPVKAFSRGMVQRVSIARAMMHNPDLLLADEPFSGLDAPSCRILQQMLDDLHAQNKTIILATHDLKQGLAMADRAIVLRAGRIVINTPSEEIDAHGVLTEIEAA